MPLTNKYLRYSPEITLEIFTLVWDKLKNFYTESYSDEISIRFNEFKNGQIVFLNQGGEVGIYDCSGLNNSETTVQEILGYDPFIKEEVNQPLKQAVHCTTQKEWCDLNGYKMENECEFQVGKWYKNKEYNDFGKCKIVDTYFRFDEVIDCKKYRYGADYTWRIKSMEINPINLSEIQQYLPDGHPDKIQLNPEFKVGTLHEGYISSTSRQFIDPSTIDNSEYGLPTEPPSYMYEMELKYKESLIKPKLILSIDDQEELPMVNIIKTKTIKELLNN